MWPLFAVTGAGVPGRRAVPLKVPPTGRTLNVLKPSIDDLCKGAGDSSHNPAGKIGPAGAGHPAVIPGQRSKDGPLAEAGQRRRHQRLDLLVGVGTLAHRLDLRVSDVEDGV